MDTYHHESVFRIWDELWSWRPTAVHRWRRRRSDGTTTYLEIYSGGPLVEALMARVQWALLFSWVGEWVLVKVWIWVINLSLSTPNWALMLGAVCTKHSRAAQYQG